MDKELIEQYIQTAIDYGFYDDYDIFAVELFKYE
jgi:hypothetical protein